MLMTFRIGFGRGASFYDGWGAGVPAEIQTSEANGLPGVSEDLPDELVGGGAVDALHRFLARVRPRSSTDFELLDMMTGGIDELHNR